MMTGKQLKDFAAKVPDEATIEYEDYSWKELNPRKIRAVLLPAEPVTLQAVGE